LKIAVAFDDHWCILQSLHLNQTLSPVLTPDT
jgi:hypothetical protein